MDPAKPEQLLAAGQDHAAAVNTPAEPLPCFATLPGRLEIFTLLVLFTPVFRRS